MRSIIFLISGISNKMSILQLVLVILYLSVSTAYNDTDVQRCPSDKASYDVAAQRFRCGGSLSYHCLQNQDGGFTESCHEHILVARDYCPVHKSHVFLDAFFCKRKPGCPDDSFYSSEVYKYPACLKLKVKQRNSTSNETTTTYNMTSHISPELITTNTPSEIRPYCVESVVTVGCILLAVVIIGILRHKFIKRRCGKRYANGFETVPLMEKSGQNAADPESLSHEQVQGQTRNNRVRRRRGRGRGKVTSHNVGGGSSSAPGRSRKDEDALDAITARKNLAKEHVKALNFWEMKGLLLSTAEIYSSVVLDMIDRKERSKGDSHPQPVGNVPSWCSCARCRDMQTEDERVCCGKKPESCISQIPDFQLLVLDELVLRIAKLNGQGILNLDEEHDFAKENRHTAYRQYVLWRYGRLGPGVRKPIPSCCVWAVRDRYPDPSGQYIGYVPKV